MRQVLAIAGTTMGEAIRRRVLLIILMIGLVFLIIAPGLSGLTPRGERQVLISLTLGVMKITAAILAVTLTVYLIPNEIERRTIYTILSKPVQRWQFLVGKFLGSVAALTLMILLMSVVLIGAFVFYQQTTAWKDLGPIIMSSLMFIFQMSLLASLAMLFSTFATPVINFFLSGFILVFGTMMNPIFERLGEGGGTAIAAILARAAHYVIPNFQNLDVSQGAAVESAQQLRGSELNFITYGVVYSITYIIIVLAIAVLIFDRKEV